MSDLLVSCLGEDELLRFLRWEASFWKFGVLAEGAQPNPDGAHGIWPPVTAALASVGINSESPPPLHLKRSDICPSTLQNILPLPKYSL